MERQTINIPWRTVRLVAVLVAVVCIGGIVAILVLSPRSASGAETLAPEQAERGLPAPTPGRGTRDVAPLEVLPTRVPDQAHSPLPTWTPTPTAVPTHTPSPTATSTPTATLTETPSPTFTPAPTHTPSPVPPTHTPAPTPTPTVVLPLSMDWVLVEVRCLSISRWALKFWLTASGGTGEYTFFHDIKRLHGPHPANGFGYELQVGTGYAAVGTFAVESGDQRVQEEFWVAQPDCSHLP
jgi:hypothetical protein